MADDIANVYEEVLNDMLRQKIAVPQGEVAVMKITAKQAWALVRAMADRLNEMVAKVNDGTLTPEVLPELMQMQETVEHLKLANAYNTAVQRGQLDQVLNFLLKFPTDED